MPRKTKTSSHPLYQVWRGMKGRCYYIKNKAYKYYGGIGVKVCEEWKNNYISFQTWCIDNGWKQGLKIDKDIIPKNLGIPALLYSPQMCSVVTHAKNMQESSNSKLNKEIVEFIRNSNEGVSALAKSFGVHTSTIHKIRANERWIKGEQ